MQEEKSKSQGEDDSVYPKRDESMILDILHKNFYHNKRTQKCNGGSNK